MAERNHGAELCELLKGMEAAYAIRALRAFPGLLSALETVEWMPAFSGPTCPICHWSKTAGHGTDCLIGNALAAARGESNG